MTKNHLKLLIGTGALLALILTVTPAGAGLITPEAWSATGENGNLGWQVTTGDFNGDGYPDLVASAPTYNGGQGSGQGGVFVWAGSASGYGELGTLANADWSLLGEVVDADSDYLGNRIATGDFNGDTYADLVVSCTYCTETYPNEGVVYVYYGSASGLGPQGTKDNADWKFALREEHAYGASQLATGDFNGDTYADLVVGASYAANGQVDEGVVYVWQGSATGLGADGTPANPDWLAESNVSNAGLGKSVASGDLNGDGYADLAVGTPWIGHGRVYVWEGSASGLGDLGTPANADWMAESDQSGSLFAYDTGHVAWGDFDGDTYADLAVSAYRYNLGENYEGAIFVWEGSASGLGADGTPTNADWHAEGEQISAYLGRMITTGDFGGDGYADLVAIKQTAAAGYLLSWYGSATGLGAEGTPANADDRLDTPVSWAEAADTNQDGYADLVAGQADLGKVSLYLADGTPPSNPTAVTETGGAQDGVWQNAVADPAFTWSGDSDNLSGVAGFFVYLGANPAGTATSYVTERAYDPTAVTSGTYYLRLSTLDNVGNQAPWETRFTFRYDGVSPSNPTAAVETGGAQDNAWQNSVSDPAFTWSGASDAHSGVAGYFVYFGADPAGTSSTYTTSTAYDPAAVSSGTYYLRVRTQDNAGNLAGWVTLFTFRYQTSWTLFLPLMGYDQPPVVIPRLDETEPNNLFEEADRVDQLPLRIFGHHDGAAGTGDVFRLDDNLMTAGEVVQATIDTANAAGLQLVVYDPQGDEIARAYEGEFVVSFVVPASGTYYIYVYTDPGANNNADYVLTIKILP